MSFFAELKRRNVFRVGLAYAIVAWLLIQVASILFPTFDAPPWVMRVFTIILILGFPVAIILAWAYELTPQGIKPTAEVNREGSIVPEDGRKYNILIASIVLGAIIGAGSYWMLKQETAQSKSQVGVQSKIVPAIESSRHDTLEESIAQIEKYIEAGNWEAAYTSVRKADKISPNDVRLQKLWPGFASRYAISTNPAGASVYRRAYDSTGDWEYLGVTPINDIRLPRGLSSLRFELKGYEPVVRTQFMGEYGGKTVNDTITKLPPVTLDTSESLPKGMVRVPGWNEDIGGKTVTFRDYFLGRYEVTNREYKTFVEAGGYRRPEFWQYPMLRDGKEIPWEDAMKLFVDKTGRPGPGTWEVGDYPAGQADYPVGGVSWYEAAAYANFVEQELPTIHHWSHAFAAGPLNGLAWVMPASNLESTKGPVPVGQHWDLTWIGAYDMAGNVREWVFNQNNGRNYILGGGWNDPYYVGMNMSYAQPPLDRSETNGFRLMSTRDDEATKTAAHLPVNTIPERNYLDEKPISDEVFKTYQSLFSYDKTPLNARVENTRTTDIWKRERITFDAAYGGERMVLYLYLPATGKPPYQTVVHWPGLAFFLDSVDDYPVDDFLLKDGRAFAFPVYKGMFERGDRSPFPPFSTVAGRNMTIQWLHDLQRSMDYLETRADIDPGKFSYYGLSWGAGEGPLVLSMEPRFRAAVLYVGGVYYNIDSFQKPLPEIDPATYLPRVKVPVLLLNGEFDSIVPLETSAKPFFELLGVKEPDKKHVIAPGGHFVPRNILIRETLNWLDKYLGPVN